MKYIPLSPIFERNTHQMVSIAWLCFGWDEDSPLRPWPQFGAEARNEGGSGVLSWVSWFGVTLCSQSMLIIGPQVAKELTLALHLHGLPRGRGWINAVFDVLRIVAPPELAEIASDNPKDAYDICARMCGEDPDA